MRDFVYSDFVYGGVRCAYVPPLKARHFSDSWVLQGADGACFLRTYQLTRFEAEVLAANINAENAKAPMRYHVEPSPVLPDHWRVIHDGEWLSAIFGPEDGGEFAARVHCAAMNGDEATKGRGSMYVTPGLDVFPPFRAIECDRGQCACAEPCGRWYIIDEHHHVVIGTRQGLSEFEARARVVQMNEKFRR